MQLELSSDFAELHPNYIKINTLLAQLEVLEDEEDVGQREASNGEAGGQTRALDQFRGPDLRGLGAHRLASCDRR